MTALSVSLGTFLGTSLDSPMRGDTL